MLGGFAVGAASVMSPAYIAEVASARYRGRLATVQQIAIISGLFCAFLSNYLLAKAAGASTEALWLGHAAWRWMFWMMAIPSMVFLLLLLLIPESPRYLVVKGRKDDALKVLTRLYGAAEAQTKLAEIDASLSADHHRPRLSDLVNKATGKLRPIVWIGIGLATFQQLVGINVVFYYGAVLWQAVGFSESDALLINVLSGGLSIGACLVTRGADRPDRPQAAAVDRLGRHGGVAGPGDLAFASASLDATGKLALSDSMGMLALVAANVYVIFFNMSWGPVMWVMLGEMFPNQIRGSGLAVAGAAQWTSNFAITVTFPDPARQHRPGRRVWHLHRRRGHLGVLRAQVRARNQGQGTRADGRLGSRILRDPSIETRSGAGRVSMGNMSASFVPARVRTEAYGERLWACRRWI